MTKILLVDDRARTRRGLRIRLDVEPDLVVVGEAADGAAAIEAAREAMPDAVVMDLRMPGMDGVAAARAIREISPRIRIIILTVRDDAGARLSAAESGVDAFLIKGGGDSELLSAIRGVRVSGKSLAPSQP